MHFIGFLLVSMVCLTFAGIFLVLHDMGFGRSKSSIY